MAASNESLNIERAWQAVALEERLEMISSAQAHGILAAALVSLLIGAVAYGFDNIWLLLGSLVGALTIMPLYTSYEWRKSKPELILKYLAVRSVARRYAFGAAISNFDVILIFRGVFREVYNSEEQERLAKQQQDTDLEGSSQEDEKEVWICLMRGGLVVLSECRGGAKLEFVTPTAADVVCRRSSAEDQAPDNWVLVQGTGISKGRTAAISSRFPAALYVFEKQLSRITEELDKSRKKLAHVPKGIS